MKTKLLAVLLLAGSSLFASPAVVVGVGFGPRYFAPRPVPIVAYRPPCPGPGYVWANGYWARPPYVRSYWVAPRYYGGRYYRGYWRR